MKLINHKVFVNIDDDKKLLINTLRGTVDEIDSRIYETLSKWQTCENIVPENDLEKELFESLQDRGLLVNDHEEEIAKREAIIKALREKHNARNPVDHFITFVMTYDCNFRCPYCFEHGLNEKKAMMSPTLIDAALDLAGDDFTVINLFGGEPLLPETRPAIAYLFSKKPDKYYDIITNGYYLTEFLDLLLKVNIYNIMVTLDGEEAIHDKKRFLENGEPTFKKIMTGIAQCLENNIHICIRMNLDSSNFESGTRLKTELLEKFDQYSELLSFEQSTLLGDGGNNPDMLADIYFQDMELPLEERKRRSRQLGKFNAIVDYITTGKKPKPMYSYCHAHVNSMMFDPYGNIYPCLASVGKEEYTIGTYYPKVEFKENSIRNRNIEKIPQCRECIYALICGGGCPLKLKDDFFRPVCGSIKKHLNEVLPTLYRAEQESRKKMKNTTAVH
ncbi:MAG: SPASM domain-containing protein [Defluviitaleaceae bacterium]|nr:SPASM domain-containing protein [Defluviitaleaceae bacterium]